MSDGTITSGEQSWPASYLTPERLNDFHAFAKAEARRFWNPYAELMDKIVILPPDLQAVAVQEFTRNLDFSAVPEETLREVMDHTRVIKMLGILVCSADIVTEENASAIYPQLVPFIRRQEVVACSNDEVNALRAAAGKPPIGG